MPKRRREVMASEVMRSTLTSVADHLKIAQDELGVAVRVAQEMNSSAVMLMDRQMELRNTRVWLLSALDFLEYQSKVEGSGASQNQ